MCPSVMETGIQSDYGMCENLSSVDVTDLFIASVFDRSKYSLLSSLFRSYCSH